MLTFLKKKTDYLYNFYSSKSRKQWPKLVGNIDIIKYNPNSVYAYLTSFIFPYLRGKESDFTSFACKINQANFTDWLAFHLPSNLMEEINPNPEALCENT